MPYGIEKSIEDDIMFYRFGRAQQVYRAPKPNLRRPYCAFIGGSETFGKQVQSPFPAILQRQTGIQVGNWGTPGAGPGFFLKDPAVIEVASNARMSIIQLMSPMALSNRMYQVYPRRNQRLFGAGNALLHLYPEVDFSQFRYVHRMLWKLHQLDPDRFAIVMSEVQSAWLARTTELLEMIEGHKILLWLHHPSIDQAVPTGAYQALRVLVEETVEVSLAGVDHPEICAEPVSMDAAAHRKVADALRGPMLKMWSANALRQMPGGVFDWIHWGKRKPA
ncbi:MAG TPA: DUF6473 family protein [Paracoccaceae bacterium]|nr:DUF6473 family protein [Paracoccaceae bacterium]